MDAVNPDGTDCEYYNPRTLTDAQGQYELPPLRAGDYQLYPSTSFNTRIAPPRVYVPPLIHIEEAQTLAAPDIIYDGPPPPPVPKWYGNQYFAPPSFPPVATTTQPAPAATSPPPATKAVLQASPAQAAAGQAATQTSATQTRPSFDHGAWNMPLVDEVRFRSADAAYQPGPWFTLANSDWEEKYGAGPRQSRGLMEVMGAVSDFTSDAPMVATEQRTDPCASTTRPKRARVLCAAAVVIVCLPITRPAN